MRYKVPQDVQQADRIVGPLTAIQLVECVIGGAIAYFFYTRVDSRPVGVMLAIVAIAITVIFVFVKINELPFGKFLVAMVLFLFRPRVRTWKKLTDTIVPPLPTAQQKAEVKVENLADAAPKQTVHELTRILDTRRVSSVDADDDEALELSSGRENTLARIQELDEKLRVRQGRADEKPTIPTNA